MAASRKDVLYDFNFQKEINSLSEYSELALRKWEPIWTPFLSGKIREEAIKIYKNLNDISCTSYGGYKNAERQRLCFIRDESQNPSHGSKIPIKGLNLKGNFLFDRARPNDFRIAIEELGVNQGEIGDIWLIRDRGAQAICSEECALTINNKKGKIRDVEIQIQAMITTDMEIPFQRIPKTINTVEASTRIDAIASAGFGLSRSKISSRIKQGYVRLNWLTVNQTNKVVNIGDLIHLETKGSIKILNIDQTKKERWRIKILRQ